MATINQTSSSNTLLANIIPVPSMSTQGLVYDSSNKIDKLLAHAFVADYNQSYLYAGRITSLAAYIAQGGSRSDEVISKIQQGLTTYLAKYYTNVDVTVAQITNDVNVDDAQITLGITMNIVENQAQINAYRLVVLDNGSLVNVINISNNGG